MDFSLKGKTALVTGASRGIGEATALGFARAGADVAVTARHLDELSEVADKIKKLGRRAFPVTAHLGKMTEIDSLVKQVKDEFGRIDILVNNAAANPTMDSAIDVTERAWDTIMNLNLKGLFFLGQAVARVMRENGGGRIINVASAGGIRPHILPVYSISKSGVIMASKIMALEWAQYGINVNAIAPGLTKTRFSQALWGDEKILSYLMARVPLKRFAEPEEIVGAMLFLASDAGNFVTGTVISVDGGETI